MTSIDDEDVRSMKTFFDECLDVIEDATACAAQLGMAYRAWMNDPLISDEAVVAEIIRAGEPGSFSAVRIGGSLWLVGAQLSPIGRDMISEGWLMARAEYPESITQVRT